MPPIIKRYTSNSIIYFKGDTDSNIYILRSGKVIIRETPADSFKEIVTYIKEGEFFGLKSALGHYPKEETAQTIEDSVVLVLDENEFLNLISKNIDLQVKILKILSKELRDTIKKVSDIFGAKVITPFDGMFSYAKYYLNNKKPEKALYFLNKLKLYYPEYAKLNNVDELINNATNISYSQEKNVDGGQQEGSKEEISESVSKEKSENDKEYVKIFYEALNYVKNEDYDSAIQRFTDVIKVPDVTDEYKIKAMYEIGRALYNIKKYDNAINIYKKILNEFKENILLKEVLYEMASTYIKLGDKEKAMNILNKIIEIQPANETTTKAKKLISTLKESKK
ncbi:MAG: cyclic nucleotide-binding domain-containing protein [Spirochaetes bacterium]|nr:cyclic nucleotide-binding domain-containing protein [Spirochaetota bacterium]